jgi:hypothetical protein
MTDIISSRRESEEAEYEIRKYQQKQRRRQLEIEEAARQQTWVRLRDEQGYQWNETVSANGFRKYVERDEKSKKLKAYSTRAGHENEQYEVIAFGQAPPVAARRKRQQQEEEEQ